MNELEWKALSSESRKYVNFDMKMKLILYQLLRKRFLFIWCSNLIIVESRLTEVAIDYMFH